MKRKLVLNGAALALATLVLGAVGAGPFANASSGDRTIRFDVVDVAPPALTAGGTAVSTESASGDTLALTATGTFEPGEGEAHGGGTFVHRKADGSVFASGFYRVNSFRSWTPVRGSLAGTGLIDAIDESEDAHSGVLKVGVAFYVNGQVVAHGLLTINCALPGAPSSLEEGFTVRVRTLTGVTFNFSESKPDNGPTLFHVLD